MPAEQEDVVSFSEIARELGVSRQRVTRIYKHGINKLGLHGDTKILAQLAKDYREEREQREGFNE